MPDSILDRAADHLRVDGFEFEGSLPEYRNGNQRHSPSGRRVGDDGGEIKIRFSRTVRHAACPGASQAAVDDRSERAADRNFVDDRCSRIVKRFGFELTGDQRDGHRGHSRRHETSVSDESSGCRGTLVAVKPWWPRTRCWPPRPHRIINRH